MKERMKYEKPALVDLRSDSALGYTSCSPNGFNVENCNLGSCVIDSTCNSGTEAYACVAGSGACVPGLCSYACCVTGSGVEGNIDEIYCWCSDREHRRFRLLGWHPRLVNCDIGGQDNCEW